MTELKPNKHVDRRIGKLCVRMDADGASIRGRRKKTWRRLPWDDVIKLACKLTPPAQPGWTEDEWAHCERKIGAK